MELQATTMLCYTSLGQMVGGSGHPERSEAPLLKPTITPLRAHSSVGQSIRLIIGRSLVRVQLGPPDSYIL